MDNAYIHPDKLAAPNPPCPDCLSRDCPNQDAGCCPNCEDCEGCESGSVLIGQGHYCKDCIAEDLGIDPADDDD